MKRINGVKACGNLRDLTGQIFGKLSIIRLCEDRYLGRQAMWECQCECGRTAKVLASKLIQGRTRSCGCLRNRPSSRRKYAGCITGSYWGCIKRHARTRNLEFKITQEFAWQLYLKQKQKCAYSGIELTFTRKWDERSYQTASLDRIDSSKGYTEDNVQWVHKDIQRLKWDLKEDRFLELISLIYNHRIKKNESNRAKRLLQDGSSKTVPAGDSGGL